MTDDLDGKPFDVLTDAGAKAILAQLAGDDAEYKRQMERARAVARALRHVRDAAILEELDRATKPTKQRAPKPTSSPKVVTNLGDLLREAAKKEDSRCPSR